MNIEVLYSDTGFGGVWALYTKGHVDKQAFVEACRDHDDGFEVQAASVYHTTGRCVPYWEDGQYRGWYLHYPARQGRGVFKLTITEDFIDLGVAA